MGGGWRVERRCSTTLTAAAAFNMLFSFMPVLMCVFGGMRTFLGPMIGAAVFATLQYNLITTMPQIYMIIFGGIMILSILFMPTGIVGVYERLKNLRNKSKSPKKEVTNDANA